MRTLGISLVVIAALLAVPACTGKSSQNSDQSASASASAAASGADTTATAAASGDVPSYPGAVTQASGSSSNMGQSAAGTVMSTDDSFDKVYTWYQQHMPSGSEKSHITSPVQTAVFMMGDAGQAQTSLTISVQGAKTMITIAHVKM